MIASSNLLGCNLGCVFFSDRRVSFATLKKFFHARIHWGDKNGKPCVRPPIECRNYTHKECGPCYHEDPTTTECRCGSKDARYQGADAILPTEHGVLSESSQGKRRDLDDLKESIREGKSMLELMETHRSAWMYLGATRLYRQLRQNLFDPTERIVREVRILYGDSGCGKTRWASDYIGMKGWSVYKPVKNNTQAMSFETYDGQVN